VSELGAAVLIVVIWVTLNFVLPRFGVPTG
jgi:hypothetical protein